MGTTLQFCRSAFPTRYPFSRPQLFRQAAGWLLLALALLILPGNGLAESRFIPRFQHFGVEDGLSQSSAVCLAQDREGFLWIGTYSGLNRYDGYTFKVYPGGQDSPGSLPDSNIRALTVDDAGTLWVGTRSGGLCRYDRATDSFVSYTHDPSNQSGIPSNEVHAIHQDSRGVIRVATAAGLAEFQKSTGSFRLVPVAQGKAGGEIMAIAEDELGQVWAASHRVVYRLDQAKGALVSIVDEKLSKILANAQISQIFPEGNNILWIVSDVIGLFRLDLSTGAFEQHLPGVGVFRLARDKWGAVWAATSKGVGRLMENGSGRRFELFGHNPYDPDSISQDDVISLLEDRSGILWAGTYSGGLNKLVTGSRWFASYRHIPGDAGSLPGKEVSAVWLGRDGSLWVGLRYEGLARLGRDRKLAQHFRNDPANPSSLGENQVNCVMEDSKGRIWVGTVENGISILDRATGKFSHFRHDPANPETLSQDKIWWLFEDSSGIVWAGTSKGGLNRIDPDTGKVKRYLNDPKNPSSLSHDRVRHVMQTRDGALWIGTNAGLNRFDPATQTFTCWRHNPKNPESLSNDRVTPILEDPSGALWVGTDNGLNRFDPASGTCRRYLERDGLADDGIQGLAMDAKGLLWMSTFKGISRLDPATGEIRNYSRRDGLAGVEFYMNAFHKGANGEMFFGSFSGLNAFQPSEVMPNRHAPATALSGLYVNNHPSEPAGGPGRYSVVLKPSDQSLTFEFAAMDFTNPHKNRYAYMLDGFETGWVDAGTTHRASYTNLDPGQYRFLVKACNDEGYWNEKVLEIAVTVIPPFWRTLWFKGLMVLAAVGSLYAVFSLRLNALKARRRELEDTVASQTASLRVEIEERVKAEAELRDSQQSFQAIFQYSPVAVAISSVHDNRILQVNNAFCSLTGFPAEEILGRTGSELGIWQDTSARRMMLDEVMASRVVLNRELGMISRDGRQTHALCSAALIDVFNEPCVLWLVSDISDRKVLELKLIDARERAEAANRAKSDFLANVSHEIRSPMNAVLGLTELALRRNPPEDMRKYLAKISSASHVLLGVINDLLDLSKIEAGKMELSLARFDLQTILDRVSDIYVSKAREKGVEFSVDILEGTPTDLVGDGLRLEQILINLVGNAVKFTSAGVVTVEVSGTLDGQGRTELTFTVRDTGIGMSPEQLGRVFKPFVQADTSTSRRFGGTGLGLSIVSKLVEMLGGRITARSTPGSGSTFVFIVPFALVGPGAMDSAGHAEDSSGLEGVRALVVDDNALNRELTFELLKMAGVESKTASGGHEALAMLEEEDFDVALLDVQMPVMDGYELSRAIREQRAGRPMILLALTAHGMSGDRERCLEAGMDGYLTKPIMPDVLFAALKKHLGRGGEAKA
ncbi:two-component regulator propeller domain-containing protein [Fundidesulfovibrio terrae]|uniref:two-component regulator propeller domain-containing protein n=1 Tax=Fundidesulfovibrio terrae TaxID=2922866 RepID=UPI001FAEC71E|nr:two-component regulator propeller domain-containing protein [Fundidesulfovibrio terrae]